LDGSNRNISYLVRKQVLAKRSSLLQLEQLLGRSEANKKKSLTGEVKQKRREREYLIASNKETVISLSIKQ
jgi:hypothetical protein